MVGRKPLRAGQVLRDTGLLLRLTAEKAARDGIGLTASALGFVTILSLVPLLAAFLFIGARTFSEYQPKVIELLADLLPYTEAALSEKLQEFLVQAQSVRGIGVLFFILSALAAFSTVERAINRAWGLSGRRPFRQKLQSFTLLLFWGSLLLGAAFSVAVSLGQEAGLGSWLSDSGMLRLLPPLGLLAGLTMLYWLVPYTKVDFRFALLGGTLATLLLTGLRAGFSVFVSTFTGFKVVYGSFAVTLFFMISIQIAWLIILAGNQLTYVAQHFEALARGRHSGTGLQGPWLGLAAVTLLAERLDDCEAVTSAGELGRRLKVSPETLRGALAPLLEAQLITETTGGFEAFVLGRAPAHLSVESIFEAYDPDALPDSLPGPLEEIRRGIQISRLERLEGCTIADLVAVPPTETQAPPDSADPT